MNSWRLSNKDSGQNLFHKSNIQGPINNKNQLTLKRPQIYFQDLIFQVHRSNSFVKNQNVYFKPTNDLSTTQMLVDNNKQINIRHFRNSCGREKNILLHKTSASWNLNPFLHSFGKKNENYRNNYLPTLNDKNFNIMMMGYNSRYGDSYIKYIINQRKAKMLEKICNKQNNNNNNNNNKIVKLDENHNQSFNIDGIIFDVSTRSDNSKSPIEGLKEKAQPQMNLQNYDFNGALKRIDSESPKGSLNNSIEMGGDPQVQTASNFFNKKLLENTFKEFFPQKPKNCHKDTYNISPKETVKQVKRRDTENIVTESEKHNNLLENIALSTVKGNYSIFNQSQRNYKLL